MAEKTTMVDDAQEKDELVLEDNQLVCALTNKVVKATDKELTLQSMIDMMAEEYGFAPEDMERDFRVTYKEPDSDKCRAQAVDLAIFDAGMAHVVDNLIRFVVVAKDAKVKPTDAKKGVDAMLDNILTFTDCEFGCWTNGEDLHYRYYTEDDFGQSETQDISDFPANGQTLADLEAQGDRAMPRKPANESLIKTFKRCHDYIYGNEGMKKTAFWELLNLIFCKLYDEKRRNMDAKEGISYRRRFWVGVKEQFTEEGRKAVADRIRGLFEELKESQVFRDVFDGSEQIMLSDRGLAFVAAELAKYSFLDATVDVKGTAYETIVSNTLKQEAGQFFTPRNIIKCMVEMLDPDQNTRVLDPACGSGGFLVTVLDHVRHKITRNLYPELDEVRLAARVNTPEVDELVRNYAEKMIFGFDFDPDLKKAARMNMVMAGDGHSNIFNINSLDYPQGDKPDRSLIAEAVNESIKHSNDKDFPFGTSEDNAQGKFDMIFTNPPFGAKVEVDCGSCSEAMVEMVEKHSRHFYIRANRCVSLYDDIFALRGWKTEYINGHEFEICSIIAEKWVGKAYRLVIQRQRSINKELDLWEGEYTYRCILTNDYTSTDRDIVEYYNKRGGAERVLDDMNNGFGWKRLPKSFMAENTVFLLLTALIRNFYRHLISDANMKSFGLKRTSRIKTFVFKYVSVPAKWIKTARQHILNIYTSNGIHDGLQI